MKFKSGDYMNTIYKHKPPKHGMLLFTKYPNLFPESGSDLFKYIERISKNITVYSDRIEIEIPELSDKYIAKEFLKWHSIVMTHTHMNNIKNDITAEGYYLVPDLTMKRVEYVSHVNYMYPIIKGDIYTSPIESSFVESNINHYNGKMVECNLIFMCNWSTSPIDHIIAKELLESRYEYVNGSKWMDDLYIKNIKRHISPLYWNKTSYVHNTINFNPKLGSN